MRSPLGKEKVVEARLVKTTHKEALRGKNPLQKIKNVKYIPKIQTHLNIGCTQKSKHI